MNCTSLTSRNIGKQQSMVSVSPGTGRYLSKELPSGASVTKCDTFVNSFVHVPLEKVIDRLEQLARNANVPLTLVKLVHVCQRLEQVDSLLVNSCGTSYVSQGNQTHKLILLHYR